MNGKIVLPFGYRNEHKVPCKKYHFIVSKQNWEELEIIS